MSENEIKKRREFEVGYIPYNYVCRKCGYTEDLYFRMNEDRPKEYTCPECKTKNLMHRNYFGKTITIPFEWNEDSFDFDQRPSGKKQYY